MSANNKDILGGEAKQPCLNGNKVQRKSDLKWWRRLVYCSAASTVALLIILLTLTVMWNQKRNQSMLPREQIVCVPCDTLQSRSNNGKDVTMGFTSTVDEKTNITNCCGKASQVVDKLVQKHSEKNYRDGYASRIFCDKNCTNIQDSKSSAKFAGISFTDMEHAADDMIYWNTTESSVLPGNKSEIMYVNGTLFINKNGYYYVFSQLKWKINGTPSTQGHTSGEGYSHYVYRHSYKSGNLATILESSKSICTMQSSKSETDSYLGAVFYLEANDTLFVKTSHPKNLVPCHHSNFFGLYAT